MTQPGAELSWTACLSLDLADRDELRLIMDQVDRKQQMEEQLCYLPPTFEDGILKSAIMISDGTIVGDVVDTSVTPHEQTPSGQVPHSEEVQATNE